MERLWRFEKVCSLMLKQKIMTVIPSWMERSWNRQTRDWGQELMGVGRNEHSAWKQFCKKWAVEGEGNVVMRESEMYAFALCLNTILLKCCRHLLTGSNVWLLFYLQFRYKLNCPWPSFFKWWTFFIFGWVSKLILDFLSWQLKAWYFMCHPLNWIFITQLISFFLGQCLTLFSGRKTHNEIWEKKRFIKCTIWRIQ